MDYNPTRFLRRDSVLNRTGIGRSTLYLLMAKGQFPKSIKLTPDGRSVAWREDEIDKWIQERIDASKNDYLEEAI